MKHKRVLLIIGILFISYVGFIGCKKKKTPTPTSMEGAWIAELVTIEGNDKTAEYAAYKISFTGANYQLTSKNQAVSSGTWAFANNNKTITLSEGITYNNVTLAVNDLKYEEAVNDEKVGDVTVKYDLKKQ